MGSVLLGALRCGSWGLLVGPVLALPVVLAMAAFASTCGGGPGGCAKGIVADLIRVALASFVPFCIYGLLRGLLRRAIDRSAALGQLFRVGRGD